MNVSTLLLKTAICLIGALVLAVCIFVLPAGIASDQTGYYRPLLLGLYVAALPFFFALYQALTLLGYIDKGRVFTTAAIAALKKINYSAASISGLFTVAMPAIYYAADTDDAPGVMVIGLVVTFASLVVMAVARLCGQLLQNAVIIKTENDLTV